MGIFGSSGASSTHSSADSNIAVHDDDGAEGEFVLAAGGYRIRVPHPSDVGHSVGDLLPTVREGIEPSAAASSDGHVTELLKEIQDSKSTASSVAEVASSDPALAASLLRTANSAAMGLSRTITSVSDAVSYLGFGTVKAMVIRLRLGEVLACKNEQAAEDSEDLWVHSLAVSYAAEHMAKKIRRGRSGIRFDPRVCCVTISESWRSWRTLPADAAAELRNRSTPAKADSGRESTGDPEACAYWEWTMPGWARILPPSGNFRPIWCRRFAGITARPARFIRPIRPRCAKRFISCRSPINWLNIAIRIRTAWKLMRFRG